MFNDCHASVRGGDINDLRNAITTVHSATATWQSDATDVLPSYHEGSVFWLVISVGVVAGGIVNFKITDQPKKRKHECKRPVRGLGITFADDAPGFAIDEPFVEFSIPVNRIARETAGAGEIPQPVVTQVPESNRGERDNLPLPTSDLPVSQPSNWGEGRGEGVRTTRPLWLRSAYVCACLLIGACCFWKSGAQDWLLNERAVAHESSPVPLAEDFGSSHSGERQWELKSIADFEVGDVVMAFNHETGQLEQSVVAQTFERTSDHLRLLTFQPIGEGDKPSSLTIKTTDEHPFWSHTLRQYVEAGDLHVGELFQTVDGQLAVLTETVREEHPEGVAVYNVEVEGLHNYFVTPGEIGARGPPSEWAVLAHNRCGDHSVYVLMQGDDVVYIGITRDARTLDRFLEHANDGRKAGAFDRMEVLAEGLTRNQARNIESAMIRGRLSERIDDIDVRSSIANQLRDAGLLNANRGRHPTNNPRWREIAEADLPNVNDPIWIIELLDDVD